jgi:hypothetical protein
MSALWIDEIRSLLARERLINYTGMKRQRKQASKRVCPIKNVR